MSYEVVVGQRSLGQFASNKGLADLNQTARAARTNYPALILFLDTGETVDAKAVARDLRKLAAVARVDISHTARNLAQMIQAQTAVRISHGV